MKESRTIFKRTVKNNLSYEGIVFSSIADLEPIKEMLSNNGWQIKGTREGSGLSAKEIKQNIKTLWKFFNIKVTQGELLKARDYINAIQFFVDRSRRQALINKHQLTPGQLIYGKYTYEGLSEALMYVVNPDGCRRAIDPVSYEYQMERSRKVSKKLAASA